MKNREIKFRVWLPDDKRFREVEYIPTMGFTWANAGTGIEIGELYPQQYTGLKDINKKEIYEGDIIKYTPFNQQDYKNTIAKVPGLRAFHWFEELEEMLEETNKCDIEVIGNIFDNPELLKNEKTN